MTLALCMAFLVSAAANSSAVQTSALESRASRESSSSDWHINITNTCNSQLKIHLRYYDGSLKHAVSNNVRTNQQISLNTEKRVIVAIVAAQNILGEDVFHQKCFENERNFMR